MAVYILRTHAAGLDISLEKIATFFKRRVSVIL